jgi:3'(2'), 5'-bisphosphate nucleotidase
MDEPDMDGSPLERASVPYRRINFRADVGRDTPHRQDGQGFKGKESDLTSAIDILPNQAAPMLDELTRIVARACALILEISPAAGQHLKPDQSPVTAADLASEAAILEGLARLAPAIPVLSEEKASAEAPPKLDGSFFVVDPLDGTREFIAGRDEFTVNLGIVTRGAPVLGIVAAPKRGLVWRGIVGGKAERLRLTVDGADQPAVIHTRRWPEVGVAVVSRSHLDADTETFLEGLKPVERLPSGSAIKFCQVADGTADIYPRLATTCEWDVAAGHAVVAAAGGIVTKPDGSGLTFGHAEHNFRIPAFVAWGDPLKASSLDV